MTGEELDVTVAVITYDSADVVAGVLESLAAGGLDGVARSEVLVVDNDSTDGTPDLVRRIAPHVRVVEAGRNGGYAAGINLARRAARPSRALLVTNADVRFRPGSVARLLAGLDEPGVGVTVAVEVLPGDRRDDSLRRAPSIARTLCDAVLGGRRAARWGLGEAVADPAAYRQPTRAAWASGAVHMISSRCLEETGPWDEGFFLYSEETDFDLRAHDAGYDLRLVPDAVIDHECGDMSSSAALWSLRAVNRVVLHRKRHGAVRGWIFWAAVVVQEGLRAPRSDLHRSAVRALVRYARTGATGAAELSGAAAPA
ncbi:MAG: glycosyltransferase family 2 protein [Acidimicrobiia bacterium]